MPDHLAPLEALRPFAEVRLIVFDVDGTLLEFFAQDLNLLLVDIQRSLARSDTKITFATGRAYHGVRPLLSVLPALQRFPIALYNGAVVVHVPTHTVLKHDIIPSVVVNGIVRGLGDIRGNIYIYAFREGLLTSAQGDFEESVFVVGSGSIPETEINGLSTTPFHVGALVDATAILIHLMDASERDSIETRLQEFDGISITRSGSKFIEVRPCEAGKAVACEIIARSLGVERSSTLTIGDADNDVDMLEWGGLSVAVKGASTKAIKASKYVANSGAMESAIELLKIIQAAKRFRKHLGGGYGGVKS